MVISQTMCMRIGFSSVLLANSSPQQMGMASISFSFSSSLLPSPLPHGKTNNTKHGTQVPNIKVVNCSLTTKTNSSSSVIAPKKRIWKEGEYPGISETSIPGYRSKRTPIKNVKKKLDRKAKAKAWVNTVAETLSDHVLKKQWIQALEVSVFSLSFHHFSVLLKWESNSAKFTKLLCKSLKMKSCLLYPYLNSALGSSLILVSEFLKWESKSAKFL